MVRVRFGYGLVWLVAKVFVNKLDVFGGQLSRRSVHSRSVVYRVERKLTSKPSSITVEFSVQYNLKISLNNLITYLLRSCVAQTLSRGDEPRHLLHASA